MKFCGFVVLYTYVCYFREKMEEWRYRGIEGQRLGGEGGRKKDGGTEGQEEGGRDGGTGGGRYKVK